jgi:hypothetical protein
MSKSNSENTANISNGSQLPNHQSNFGRNELCSCGSGKKFKNCCLKSTPTKGVFPAHRFKGYFGLQVHIDDKCKMTFSVPKERFIQCVDLIRASNVHKEYYLSMVKWDDISFGYSNEMVHSICFHLLAATLLDIGFQNPYEIPFQSWIMNIPSNHFGKVEAVSFSHENWFESASDFAGVNFQ